MRVYTFTTLFLYLFLFLLFIQVFPRSYVLEQAISKRSNLYWTRIYCSLKLKFQLWKSEGYLLNRWEWVYFQQNCWLCRFFPRKWSARMFRRDISQFLHQLNLAHKNRYGVIYDAMFFQVKFKFAVVQRNAD